MKRVKVTLRSRPISGGRRTLYLDYYPAAFLFIYQIN